MIADHGRAEDLLPTEDLRPGTAPAVVPRPQVPMAADNGDGERNLVFTNLVREDADIVGLVAYSIYKQNKLDWLQAFERIKGRAPEPGEQAAYIIGESTPRRLAIYRHLADATLMGQGPEPGTEAGSKGFRGSVRRGPHGATSWFGPSLIAYVALAIVILIAFYLAFHFTAR